MHPGVKILNNLGSESAIEDNLFDKVFHMPATQAAKIIDPILKERLQASED